MTSIPVPLTPVRRSGPYLALAGLQIADVATTFVILSAWSARAEGNPIAAALFGRFGLAGGCALLLALKLGIVTSLWTKQTGVRLVSALYGAVLANNVLFLILWALR